MGIQATYVRDAKKVHAGLMEVDNTLVATKPIKILFPERWLDLGYLAKIEDKVSFAGFCIFVVDNKYYGQCSAQTLLSATPDSITVEKFDDDPYVVLNFLPGSTILPNLYCVKSGPFSYRLNEEIIGKANVPQGMTYGDILGFYDTLQFHGGINPGVDTAILEFMASLICRNKKNPQELFRSVVTSEKDLLEGQPPLVSLGNVALNATNTSAKLLGNYYQEGLSGALVVESTRLESIEKSQRS